MLQEISDTSLAAHDWDAAHGPAGLESRLQRLESRVEHLESITESRVENLRAIMETRMELKKAEIWKEIWEERLKVLFAVSVGVVALTWIVVIVRALR